MVERGTELFLRNLASAHREYDHELTVSQQIAALVEDYGTRELRACIASDIDSVLEPAAQCQLSGALRNHLTWTAHHVLEWEWQVFRTTPEIQRGVAATSMPELYFASGVAGETLRMLRSYPALAQLWAKQVRAYVTWGKEFVSAIRYFIEATRRGDSRRRRVIEVQPNQSDPHRGNKSVIQVTFSDSTRWYYKPRSAAPELRWFSLLHQLNRRPSPSTFLIPRIISGRTYFWIEAVPHDVCREWDKAEMFAFRAGSLLYLLHLLRAVDCHAGNIIAFGAHPVLIDCETLLHPDDENDSLSSECELARTGLLPLSLSSNQDSYSAFGRTTRGSHSLLFYDQQLFVSDFPSAFEEGFRAMHRFIRRRETGDLIAGYRLSRCRYLLRPTSYYYNILDRSLSRDRLRATRTRAAYLRRVTEDEPLAGRRAITQYAALAIGDVPVFYGRPAVPRRVDAKQFDRNVDELRYRLALVSRNISRPGATPDIFNGVGSARRQR